VGWTGALEEGSRTLTPVLNAELPNTVLASQAYILAKLRAFASAYVKPCSLVPAWELSSALSGNSKVLVGHEYSVGGCIRCYCSRCIVAVVV